VGTLARDLSGDTSPWLIVHQQTVTPPYTCGL